MLLRDLVPLKSLFQFKWVIFSITMKDYSRMFFLKTQKITIITVNDKCRYHGNSFSEAAL